MREVATYLACNSSNLTGITDRLEDRKLVQRTADPNDRRIKLLVLTPEGESSASRSWPASRPRRIPCQPSATRTSGT